MSQFCNYFDFSQKKGVITGGTKGIGLSIAEKLLDLGAEIIFCARNSNDVQKAESKWQDAGFSAKGISIDLSEEKEVDNLIEFVNRNFHKLDFLINNAGTNIRKSTEEYTDNEINFIFNLNYFAPLKLCRSLKNLLLNSDSASILNIGSIAGKQIVRTGSPYASSKAALAKLTEYLAVEWGEENIRCNAIQPWYIETPLVEPVLNDKEKYEKILEKTPLGRIGRPEEVANLAIFLLSSAASFLSGQVIDIDGAASKFMF